MHASVLDLWRRYRLIDASAPEMPPPADYFCDNRADAEECSALVLAGRKRATASALVEYAMNGEPVPTVGTFAIVTDFDGIARALVRTHTVTVRRFADVDAGFAALEGEGDGTLGWWREVHHAFWTRALAGTPHAVDDDLLVVCEEFDLVLSA